MVIDNSHQKVIQEEYLVDGSKTQVIKDMIAPI